jgi:hypothetical protein
MPARKPLACEPDGPRGILGFQRAVPFLERGALGREKHGRCPVFLRMEGDEKMAGSPITFQTTAGEIRRGLA